MKVATEVIYEQKNHRYIVTIQRPNMAGTTLFLDEYVLNHPTLMVSWLKSLGNLISTEANS